MLLQILSPHGARLGWPHLREFAQRELQASMFPLSFFALLAISKLHIPGLPRYDFLLLGCVAIQGFMVWRKLESTREVLTLAMFHLLGLCLELYKVRMGSWAYPEFAYSKVAGVPLYSGFMYASIGSYVCQAWRLFDLKIQGWPGWGWAYGTAAIAYLNFFTLHVMTDLRWPILALIFIVFGRVGVNFSVGELRLRMPLMLSYVLIGFFIYLAENYCSRFGAYLYPRQRQGWHWVDPSKISSWTLLVMWSVILVAQLKIGGGAKLASEERVDAPGSRPSLAMS